MNARDIAALNLTTNAAFLFPSTASKYLIRRSLERLNPPFPPPPPAPTPGISPSFPLVAVHAKKGKTEGGGAAGHGAGGRTGGEGRRARDR